ncbi:hypothetical protein D5R93_02220 [Actinomyces lilanjuaniae]|uniref:Uncharacterized protein n=1 Tax=Actinomyces lilanjuaniae TaxID=2321394 RepID=A0ABM6Z1T7_9ACTO|nr:hypothetical protein [Actinomyces lilanjuaniae]AYD89163.1 hypothetical protein D5R93_02220 [Actinomyces lilanjuaniae]
MTPHRITPDPVIDQARTALDAYYRAGDVYQRWQARQDLADHADVYVDHLLDEIDHLTEMIRDLDQQATRDDPAHDTTLEAAYHEVSRLRRTLDTERQQALRALQRAARTVRRAYQDGYTHGLQEKEGQL